MIVEVAKRPIALPNKGLLVLSIDANEDNGRGMVMFKKKKGTMLSLKSFSRLNKISGIRWINLKQRKQCLITEEVDERYLPLLAYPLMPMNHFYVLQKKNFVHLI